MKEKKQGRREYFSSLVVKYLILLLLVSALFFVLYLKTQVTIVSARIADEKIVNARSELANVTNAVKWFGSYLIGKYTIRISYDSGTDSIADIQAGTVVFYLDERPTCINLELFSYGSKLDAKSVGC